MNPDVTMFQAFVLCLAGCIGGVCVVLSMRPYRGGK
jgi:hypothetical protein